MLPLFNQLFIVIPGFLKHQNKSLSSLLFLAKGNRRMLHAFLLF